MCSRLHVTQTADVFQEGNKKRTTSQRCELARAIHNDGLFVSGSSGNWVKEELSGMKRGKAFELKSDIQLG